MPSFPKEDLLWPWGPDRTPNLGWVDRDFDTSFLPPLRERLFNPRPWIGRATLDHGSTWLIPTKTFRTLCYCSQEGTTRRIHVLYGGAFVELFEFDAAFLPGDFLHYPIVSENLAAVEAPFPLDPDTNRTNAPFPGGVTIRYPRPPRIGRWNQTRWSWSHTFSSPEGPAPAEFIRVAWEFHFQNGCWAGFDESWQDWTLDDVPEISPVQESILTTALQGEGFDFDPDMLLIDYALV